MASSSAELVLPAAARPRPGAWMVLVRFVRKKPLGAAGGFLMLVMLLTALFAEPLATHDPIATDAAHTLARPGADHWLGSDHLGRDIYSRIVHGARVSLVVGVMSTLLGSVLGGLIGLLSAYFGGKTDLITQRILDILQGLPLLVLALVMSAARWGRPCTTSSSPSRSRSSRAPPASSARACWRSGRCSTSRRRAPWGSAICGRPSATSCPTRSGPSSC
jgi:hypothetical protein